MKQKNKKKLIALGLTTSMFLTGPVSLYAKNTNTLTQQQQQSQKPIVEITKDTIYFHKSMVGEVKLYVHGTNSKFDYSLNIKTQLRGDGKDAYFSKSISQLKTEYVNNMKKFYKETSEKDTDFSKTFSGKISITYTEKGKKASETITLNLKNKYDKPNVEFIQRKDKDNKAKFKITFSDNKNFKSTPITNKFSKIKITSTTSTDISFTKDNGAKNYLEYEVPKTTPNGTVFKFVHFGDNFESSEEVKATYQVDKTETDEILKLIDTSDEEIKKVNSSTIEAYKKKVNEKNITQEELDNINSGTGALLRTILSDELVKEKKSALEKIEKELNELDQNKKNKYKTQITSLKKKVDLAKLNNILEQAEKENKKILEDSKSKAISDINKLTNLKMEKDSFIEKIKASTSSIEIKKILENAKIKSQEIEKQNKEALKEKQQQAIKEIKTEKYKLIKYKEDEYIKRINSATEILEIDKILQQALEEVKRVEEKFIEDTKNDFLKELEKLGFLTTDDKNQAKEDLDKLKDINYKNVNEEVAKLNTKYFKLNIEKEKLYKDEAKKNINLLSDLENKDKFLTEVENAKSKEELDKIFFNAKEENNKNKDKKEREEKQRLEKELTDEKSKAIEIIKSLSNFESEKNEFIEKVNKATKKEDVEQILKQAKEKSNQNKINKEKKEREEKEREKREREENLKKELEIKKKEATDKINKLSDIENEKQGFIEDVNKATKKEDVEQILKQAQSKSKENKLKKEKEEEKRKEAEKQKEIERQKEEEKRRQEEEKRKEAEKQKEIERQKEEERRKQEEKRRQEEEKRKEAEKQKELERQRKLREKERLENEKRKKDAQKREKERQEKERLDSKRRKEEQEKREKEREEKIKREKEQKRIENTENKNIRFLNGKNQVFNKKVSKKISFRISKDIVSFKDVYLNGKLVDKSMYTIKRGSTIVTFNEDFSKNLALGSHEFKFQFKEGYTKTNIFVVENKKENKKEDKKNVNNKTTKENKTKKQLPKTNIALSSQLFGLLSSLALAFSFRKRK